MNDSVAVTTTIVGLCTGKHCRKREEFAALREAVIGWTSVIELPCLDICKGPVVLIEPSSEHAVVLARVRSGKELRDLGLVVAGRQPLSERLQRRRVVGAKRRSALRRASKALRRTQRS